ncbi:MAG: beta-ketoacyl-ACP synthase II [Spirochaetales bacterium]|jgi:3-oxoacyl-[acyl-carrier-protein] synthase II|nr:beta-ketoacyl-ACP synthase II [Spirochaetales bacterium]
MSTKKRIVVTGLGALTPLGNSVKASWEGVTAGKSGVGPITHFDTEGFETKIAAELKNFEPRDFMDGREARKMDRFSQVAVAAAKEALGDAGFTPGSFNPERAGVVLGVGIGGFDTIEQSHKAMLERGPDRIPPMTIPKLIANIGPGNVAIHLDLRGPCYTVTTACSSGTDAIGSAVRWLENGSLDFILAGGVEAVITPFCVAAFNVIQAMSTRNSEPERASRPFDKDRDGFVMGEGAGILVLETLEHALARNAKIYAEYGGYGISCDANHLTAPHPEGRGAVSAIKMALQDAGLAPEDIDYINAHGTSTPVNDPVESAAIKNVFGAHAYKLKVSSTKSMTGHTLGAAGGIEALFSVLAVHTDFFPPTLNLDNPDPLCDLDYVAKVGVQGPPGSIRAAMSNTFGFGGHNGILVFKKYAGA